MEKTIDHKTAIKNPWRNAEDIPHLPDLINVYKDVYGVSAALAERLSDKLEGVDKVNFLRIAYNYHLDLFDHQGTRGFSHYHMPGLILHVTDEPMEVYPHENMTHVTSSLMLDDFLESAPGRPIKILELSKQPTHKGSLLYLMSFLMEDILNKTTQEKDRFVWLGSKADAFDYASIQKDSELTHDDRVLQLETLKEQFISLTNNPTDEILDAIMDLFFDATGVREGFNTMIKSELEELSQTDQGKEQLQRFVDEITKILNEGIIDPPDFFPIAIKVNMEKAFKLSSVNGVNLIPVRKQQYATPNIAGLTRLCPGAVEAIYMDPQHIEKYKDIVLEKMGIPVLDIKDYKAKNWIAENHPNGYDPSSEDARYPQCMTRYVSLNILKLYKDGVITPFESKPINPLITFNKEKTTHLHALTGSDQLGLDMIPDLHRQSALQHLGQLPQPGLYHPITTHLSAKMTRAQFTEYMVNPPNLN